MRRAIFEPEHEDFRESVRGFLQREAVPHAPRGSSGDHRPRVLEKAAAQGYVAFSAPEELGGAGQRTSASTPCIDEEVASTGTVGDDFTLVNDIVAPYLTRLANDEQQARWLPGVTSGERVPRSP